MRIAQLVSLQESVPPKGKNGLEYVVHYLTEELVRRGHEVTLFATGDSVTSARLVEVMPYPLSRGALFDFSSTHYALMATAKAAEMAGEFDIIHSHLGAPAYYFAELLETPIVETIHSAHTRLEAAENLEYLKPYLCDCRRREHKIHRVFVSRNQQRCFSKRPNSSVIHNGIGFEDFTFQSEKGDYFAYLGYLTPEKGAHLAIEAARRANVKLRLAGNYFGCEDYFKKKIKPHLRKGQIEYVGVLGPAERNVFLGNARALLFPIEWEEPFGLVMIEAMACGTPVIGFDRAAVGEVVKHGSTGVVVKDAAEMAGAIRQIEAIDPAACRRRAEKNFSASRMADKYERLYEKIFSRHKEK